MSTPGTSCNPFLYEESAKFYSLHRRDTPVEVVEKIISFLKEKYDGPLKVAVDVACGAGQSTVNLVKYFDQVYGTDISESQIEQAKAFKSAPNLEYTVSPAESLQFASGSVQLVTVACALHWFELDKFFSEVQRVLSPGGVLAVTGYNKMMVLSDDPKLVEQQKQAFDEVLESLKSYWDPLRNLKAPKLDKMYPSVNFPFEEVIRDSCVRYTHDGCLSDIVNFIKSLTGFQNYRKKDPQGAQNCIDRLQGRLCGIGASLNLKLNDVTTLYEDFHMILCRKS